MSQNRRAMYDHRELLGWAFTDAPTIEAYQKSTGEEIKPAFGRYQDWIEENIIGGSDDGQSRHPDGP